MAKKAAPVAKKTARPEEAPRDRRCSFRAVAEAKKSAKLSIEHQRPGSTIWVKSVVGLGTEDVEAQLRRLEAKGCPIEYNEFFQPAQKRR